MSTPEILAGEMTTGRRLTVLPVVAASFSQGLGATGDVTATIPLKDPAVRARSGEFFGQLEPWRSFLAVQVGQQIIEAGPIVSHDYDDTTGHLTVKAQGGRAIFDHRLAIDAAAATVQASTLTYTDLSLGTIAKRLVQRTLANPGGGLPIVLPADEAGTHERTYPGFELASLAQRLDNLTGVSGGPEIAFEPRLTSDSNGVEWVMRVGTTAKPLLSQTGADWIFDTTTRGSVGGLSVSKDATNRTNSVYVSGSGQDTALMVARTSDSSEWARGYPLLEAAYSHSTVEVQATLDQWPGAYLAAGSRPWSTWKLTVERDGSPSLGEYRAGDWVSVVVAADHAYLPGGTYRARISSLSGSVASQMVDLNLIPTMDGR